MARLIWSPQALANLEEILNYLAQESPRAATSLGSQILDAVEHLQTFPRSGRVVPDQPDQALRELIVSSYRIFYHVGDDTVELLAIRHGARRPPNGI
jgi:toxin ParE1/3/4